MTSKTVLVTDPIGGDPSTIAEALASFDLAMALPAKSTDWRDLSPNADALIVNLATIDASAFERLVKCRVVARTGVGINNIDLGSARARDIVVTNVPDYCRDEVSDHALTLMLCILRKVTLAASDVKRGVWNQLGYRPIRRLSALTLGLVGFGRIAKSLGKKATALGMRVLAYDPYALQSDSEIPFVGFDELLSESDVLSIHAPLSPETKNLIGSAAIRKMKRGAVLINTSRGEVVDEFALAAALDSGHLSAAALDVVTTEPLAADSCLRDKVNVLVTPHMAFYSEESLNDLQRTAVEDVARVLSGREPRHRVI